MKEFFEVLAFVGGVFVLAVAIIYPIGSYQCSTHEEVEGVETKFTGFNCYRKIGDKWLTDDQYNMYIINNVK